jgi:hypothetical protein
MSRSNINHPARFAALAAGALTFDGVPCRYGHEHRYTRNGRCVQCQAATNRHISVKPLVSGDTVPTVEDVRGVIVSAEPERWHIRCEAGEFHFNIGDVAAHTQRTLHLMIPGAAVEFDLVDGFPSDVVLT